MTMTFGQMMLADILPADLYHPGMPVNKKQLSSIMSEVAQRSPEQYGEISKKILRLGLKVGQSMGGASFGLKDLQASKEIELRQHDMQERVRDILGSEPDPKLRRQKISQYLRGELGQMSKTVYDDSVRTGNRFALQLEGAGRGNRGSLMSLRGGDVLATDSAGNDIPIPLNRSFTQGLTPGQYHATAYGARRNISSTKLAVGSSGYLSKLIQQAAHRLAVVDDDDRTPTGQRRGFMVDADDADNVGALLAEDVGPYKRDTPITPSMLGRLKRESDEILIRSPIASSSLDGGVYAKDVGVREFGRLARRGEHVGMPAAQAIGEIVTQASLSSKHSGAAGADASVTPGLSGFALIDRLMNPPKEGRGLAAHAQLDGRVESIKDAPQGGQYVMIHGQGHYVAPGFKTEVKVGDRIEAGDVLSNGIPDPTQIINHKGIGEGRRYFVTSMRRGLDEAGFPVARRNIELLARGLVDRVRVDHEFGDFIPGSLVSYSRVEKTYQPREDSQDMDVGSAEGRYLEEPVLHYTVGTRMTPNTIKRMQSAKINRVRTHKEPAPFSPVSVRGADILQSDPDFMTQFLGSHLQKSLTNSIQLGAESDEDSTSFVPVRASAINLGRTELTKSHT